MKASSSSARTDHGAMSASRILYLLVLRLRSLKRPSILAGYLAAPIIIAIVFKTISKMGEIALEDPFLRVLAKSFQLNMACLLFQAAISSIFIVDILGGESKHNEDLTLLSTLPLRKSDQFITDFLLGLLCVFVQMGILNATIVIVCSSSNTMYLIPLTICVLWAGSVGPTVLIVALTLMFIELLSGTVAYFAAPMVFVSWRLLIIFIVTHYETMWSVFVLPSTMILMFVATLPGISGTALIGIVYPTVTTTGYLTQAQGMLWSLTVVSLCVAALVHEVKRHLERFT